MGMIRKRKLGILAGKSETHKKINKDNYHLRYQQFTKAFLNKQKSDRLKKNDEKNLYALRTNPHKLAGEQSNERHKGNFFRIQTQSRLIVEGKNGIQVIPQELQGITHFDIGSVAQGWLMGVQQIKLPHDNLLARIEDTEFVKQHIL